MNTIPVSLRNPELMAVWKTARQQLDRHGHERRGTVRMPTLSDSSSLALSSLLGKRLTARLDLNQLEQALQLQGIGRDLDDALALLGMPPSKARAAERAKNERRRAARDAAEAYVADWLEAWSGEWLNWLFQSGQMVHEDAESVSQLMQLIRALLDRRLQAKGDLLARNDLAVSICGSAHALDDGALVERCTRRALWHTLDQQPAYRDGRDVWVMAGILPDQVSAPVLTWHLPLQPESELGKLCAAAHSVSVPLHLTLMALMKHDIVSSHHEPVLLVENPRLVEAAAQRQCSRCVIATNGNPSSAVMRLVSALLINGVEVRCHGDFDTAGLAICRRLTEVGCRPWQMSTQDYIQAQSLAGELGIDLPANETRCGPTPWDPQLQVLMNETGLAVHEELVIDRLLDASNW